MLLYTIIEFLMDVKEKPLCRCRERGFLKGLSV
jgi:hypothetical protein